MATEINTIKTQSAQLTLDHGHTIKLWVASREDTSTDGCCALVLVHGGPGLDDHMGLLEAFERNIFKCSDTNIGHIVAYDQLGCGESDKFESTEHYTLDSYVQELEHVLRWTEANVCTKLFVLGHSWGGQVRPPTAIILIT